MADESTTNATADSSTATAHWKGTSRYEVVRRIGEGAMGVVYEALDRAARARRAEDHRCIDASSLIASSTSSGRSRTYTTPTWCPSTSSSPTSATKSSSPWSSSRARLPRPRPQGGGAPSTPTAPDWPPPTDLAAGARPASRPRDARGSAARGALPRDSDRLRRRCASSPRACPPSTPPASCTAISSPRTCASRGGPRRHPRLRRGDRVRARSGGRAEDVMWARRRTCRPSRLRGAPGAAGETGTRSASSSTRRIVGRPPFIGSAIEVLTLKYTVTPTPPIGVRERGAPRS